MQKRPHETIWHIFIIITRHFFQLQLTTTIILTYNSSGEIKKNNTCGCMRAAMISSVQSLWHERCIVLYNYVLLIFFIF